MTAAKTTNPTRIPTVQDLIAALQRGEDAIRDAAKIVCEMVDANPNAYQEIRKQTGIDWKVLANLERVGRGAMNYNLLLDTSPAARYIALLPASQQGEVYEKGVKVATTSGGKTFVTIKKVQELTPFEAKIVFDSAKIRSVDEQINTASKPTPARAMAAQRYIIKDDCITIFSNTTFTMSQLQDILEGMKDKAIKSLAKKR